MTNKRVIWNSCTSFIKLIIHYFNSFHEFVRILFLNPFLEWFKVKFYLSFIFFQPTKVKTKNLAPILFLEHSIYYVTAEELELQSASQNQIFTYIFVSFWEYIAYNYSVAFFKICKKFGFVIKSTWERRYRILFQAIQ
jgi:hypothetical protein